MLQIGIVVVIIAAALFFAVRHFVLARKNGCCGCGGCDCSSSGCCGCPTPDTHPSKDAPGSEKP